nr:insulinase family protein [Treponema sp.]
MFDVTDKNNIGKEYNGFILLGIDELADYKTQAVFLRHKKTGLEIYHILKEDKENLFAFAFRTFANDSKGCAHIMEHSTLCGSEKYPLKEPFTTLAGTSLNTFLNALTYPDKTVYPGASVVRADYFNMMDVYADAVFFPKLDYTTFIQEGHRLELD